jgi:hypothetical protein
MSGGPSLEVNKWTRRTALAFALIGLSSICSASIVFTGTDSFDADITSIQITVISAGNFSALSLGYGGSLSPFISAGGFATSLSLYETNDPLMTQIASDFVGGTAAGPVCSNGAQQDPSTHLCEDATLTSIPLGVGTYVLTLTGQYNNGPGSLDYTQFPLAPGTNNGGGAPFGDPGLLPGSVFRDGNWGLSLDFTGGAAQFLIPEPSVIFLSGLGLSFILLAARRRLGSR